MSKNIADIAFYELYPDKKNTRELRIKYSRAFRSYNANVKYTHEWMEFKLSYEWKKISDEMKIGLIQNLLVKVFKDKNKQRTINMDLYDNFIKGIGEYRPATEIDPILDKSFERVNQKYFDGFMEKTNLVWGQHSFSKLGMYTYGDNTITISKALADNDTLMDYVVYHEMLHKKHKYKTTGGRSHHHTKAFRDDEAKFDLPDAERQLENYLRKKRWNSNFKSSPAVKEDVHERKEKERKKKIKSLLDWFLG